jgi:hypothetical protein
MPSTSLAIETEQPAIAAIASKSDKTLRITGKVRAAIDLMVWTGLKRDEAAQQSGMKDNSLYVALTRPDVKAYYLRQCEVLRTSGRARRIHRLEAMLEQDDNKAAVINAALALDRIGEADAISRGTQMQPGMQIVIVTGTPLTQVSAHPIKTIEQSDG